MKKTLLTAVVAFIAALALAQQPELVSWIP